MTLMGEHIYLRPLELSDANGNYPNWLNDPEICKYNSHGDVKYTKQMAVEYIQNVQKSENCEVFAICDKKTNQHIGNIALQDISEKNKSAEFAIMFGEVPFMGKGLSKEAGSLLIKYGFETLSLHRIHCGTSIHNIPMQKLALYLNMKQEGIRRDAILKNGKYFDTIVYGIISNKI